MRYLTAVAVVMLALAACGDSTAEPHATASEETGPAPKPTLSIDIDSDANGVYTAASVTRDGMGGDIFVSYSIFVETPGMDFIEAGFAKLEPGETRVRTTWQLPGCERSDTPTDTYAKYIFDFSARGTMFTGDTAWVYCK